MKLRLLLMSIFMICSLQTFANEQMNNSTNDTKNNQSIMPSSASTTSDATITAKIKALFVKEKLFGDKDISAMTISVETTNGVVHLSGTADNKKQANNAKMIAKSVKGVKKVTSDIQIKAVNNDTKNADIHSKNMEDNTKNSNKN